MQNNKLLTVTIITSVFIIAVVIVLVVWLKNSNSVDNTLLKVINTPLDYGTNGYDVMLNGNRNDSMNNNSTSLLGL